MLCVKPLKWEVMLSCFSLDKWWTRKMCPWLNSRLCFVFIQSPLPCAFLYPWKGKWFCHGTLSFSVLLCSYRVKIILWICDLVYRTVSKPALWVIRLLQSAQLKQARWPAPMTERWDRSRALCIYCISVGLIKRPELKFSISYCFLCVSNRAIK